ncbi:MAG: hypothetical protein RBQ97_10065 [Acholeplasma sp.]|nr:hypothetical protein [Acholeplasma sp.]
MSDFYNIQKELIPDDCMIVRDVNYDDIDEKGIIIKSLFNQGTEYSLTKSSQSTNDTNFMKNKSLQQIAINNLNGISVFKKIGNKIYFELIVDSKSDINVKYLIDMIIADLNDTYCPTCGSQYVLNINETRILPNESKCIKCTIECPKCKTILDMIKFNAVLFFTDIAYGATYSDITINGEVGHNITPKVGISVTTNLPKKYFRC